MKPGIPVLLLLAVLATPGLLRAKTGEGLPTASPPTAASQTARLKAITLTFDFRDATIDEAITFFRVESQRFDPDHQGFNFVISAGAASSAKPATLALNKVSFEQGLQSFCEQAGVKYVVEARVIRILAASEKAPDAVSGLPAVPPGDKAAMATRHKLDTIFIDRVNFEKLDVAAALQFIENKSRDLDPDHTGVSLVLGPIPDGSQVHRTVSLTLDTVSLADLIFEIEAQTKLHASVGDNIVTFRP